LFVPMSHANSLHDTDTGAHTDIDDDTAGEFLVAGHVRPSTTQTLYREDLIGDWVREPQRPLVARSLRREEIIEGEIRVSSVHELIRVLCIPVRFRGRTIAVLSRESAPTIGRSRGELERTYIEIFNRFAAMIAAGTY